LAGECWDNPAAETFLATLKNEIDYQQAFATKPRARARIALAEHIEVSGNRKRMHSSIGYRTPAQALNDDRTAARAACTTEGIKRETARNP
jgi:transposase InsO family protein